MLDSLLQQWIASDRGSPRGAALLALVEQRWRQAAAGPLQPRILAHREQGRLLLDLHGFSAWTGQLAVLHTLDTLLHQWQLQMPGRLELELGQGQGQGQRQRQRRRDLGGPGYCGWLGGGVPRLHIITGRGNRRQEEERYCVHCHSVANCIEVTDSHPPTHPPILCCSIVKNRSVLREMVLAMLQQLLPVTCPTSNDGVVVLEAADLARLLGAMSAGGAGFSLHAMQHILRTS